MREMLIGGGEVGCCQARPARSEGCGAGLAEYLSTSGAQVWGGAVELQLLLKLLCHWRGRKLPLFEPKTKIPNEPNLEL